MENIRQLFATWSLLKLHKSNKYMCKYIDWNVFNLFFKDILISRLLIIRK